MKVVLNWVPAGATLPQSFTLADSPATVPMTDFVLNGTRTPQEDKGIRAAAVTLRGRGNRKTSVSFNTSRSFTDIPTAEAFALMHETTLPDGLLLFTVVFTAGAGAATTVRYLRNAELIKSTVAVVGATTRHSYQIDGPVMTIN